MQTPHISQIHSAKFSDFVEGFRVYEFREQSVLNLDPEGNFELIFQVKGDFCQRPYGTEKWEKRPKNFVGGLHSTSFQIKNNDPGSKLISVRFKPLGARHFIPDRLNLFKNSLIDLSDLNWKNDGLEPKNDTTTNFVNSIDHFLEQAFKPHDKNAVDVALKMIHDTNGFIPIRKVCRHLTISESCLRRIFNEQIGLSPKAYAKITRVNYIKNFLSESNYESLTKLSYELGYYDQSHFIKDFKSVTGRSPKQYITSR